jgi:anti-sigma factor RsiW
MNDCEKYRPMLVGLTDNELTPEEINDVNKHLNRCKQCRKEFDEMKEMSENLGLPSFKEPEDEVLEQLWKSPYSRFARNAGIVMVIGGYLALIGYALYEFMIDNREEMFPKVAIAALIIGFLIMLGSVIRERIKTYKTDAYKEVER